MIQRTEMTLNIEQSNEGVMMTNGLVPETQTLNFFIVLNF
jgi:hypothetical protein